MTQAQKSLYNLFLRVNKRSRDAGEPCIDAPQQAFTTLAEATMDTVAREIVAESRKDGAKGAEDQEKDAFMPGQIAALLSLYFNKNKEADEADPKGGLHAVAVWALLTTLKWTVQADAESVENKEPERRKGRKSRIAKNYILPTCKVLGILNQLDIGDQQKNTAKVEVIHGKKKSPAVHTIIQLTPKDRRTKIDGNIDGFDMAILNGITSLLDCGNDFITVDMAYRATAGDTAAKSIAETQRADAKKSIDKLLRTFASFDATEEAKAYRKGAEYFKFSGPLLSATEIDAKLNGVQVHGYQFAYRKDGTIDMPIHYKYAQISGQIATVPVELLNIPVNSTKTNIVLRDFLLKRIGAMKNPKATMGDKIAFTEIYDLCNQTPGATLSKAETKRIRDTTFKMLDGWIATDGRKGLIKGYTVYNKGNTIAGVTIAI